MDPILEAHQIAQSDRQNKETVMDFNQLMARMRELDQPTTEAGCGMPTPSAPPALSAVPPEPDTPPPSMTVSLNAQGMSNIEQMMKLFQKVNPDMMPKDPMPMPTLKMLPSMGSKATSRDMLSPKEEFANSPTDASDTEYKGIDAAIPSGNDLNKPKKTFPKVAGGDNPMQRVESQTLVGSIKEYLEAELLKHKSQ
jgi:hypothetical protein